MNWYMQTTDGSGLEVVDARGCKVVNKEEILNRISYYSPKFSDRIPVGVESRNEHIFGYIITESRDVYGRLGYAVFHALRSELMQPGAEDFFLTGLSGLHARFSNANAQRLQQEILKELNGENSRGIPFQKVFVVAIVLVVLFCVVMLLVK